MSSPSLTVLPPAPSPDGKREYATADEARAALTLLTGPELKKLQLVAELHCRKFGIPSKHMEPRELLNEAFLKTLNLDKKWRKGITILHHLNRAMQNIAGHEVPKKARTMDVGSTDAGEEEQDADEALDSLRPPETVNTVVAAVEARDELRLLEEIFNDDKPALHVLTCRASGQEGKEIQDTLNLTKKDYDAISTRILRKTKSYYEPKSQAVRPGQGA